MAPEHQLDVPRTWRTRRGIRAGGRPRPSADEGRDAARQGIVGLLRADEVNVGVDAPGGQQKPLARDGLGRDADDHALGHAGHDIGIAGLPNAGDAASLDADVRLPNARPVDDQRIGDDAVECAIVGDACCLAHAVAQHLAAPELALVSIDGGVLFDFGDEIGVSQSNAVAGCRTVEIRVVPSFDAMTHGTS